MGPVGTLCWCRDPARILSKPPDPHLTGYERGQPQGWPPPFSPRLLNLGAAEPTAGRAPPARLRRSRDDLSAELFTRACAELGIRHLSATAGRPEGKGKIERFFQTFQAEFLPELYLHPVQTLEALNERLWAWIEEAYHVRPHSETGEPPAERFLRDLKRRAVPPEHLQRVFLWRQVRRVDKTGVLQFAGNRYQAPAGTEYRKVELRYHPLHLEALEVWREGRFVGKATPLDLYRSRLDRVARAHEPASSERRTGLPYLELLLQRHEERKHQIVSPLRFDPQKEVKADV